MAAAAAACELPNVVGFGFRPRPVSSSFTPSTFSCFTTTFLRNKNKNKICKSVWCSLVNSQQQSWDHVSFSEDENLLIEALIGIQGRGRSASPQQLQVCLFLHFLIILPYYIAKVLLEMIHA